MPSVLVRTVSGLEALTAAEITAAGHRVLDITKRQLVVEGTALVATPPRLADDLFIIHGQVPDPGPYKHALVTATAALTAATAAPYADRSSSVLGEQHEFAVTASFVGRRNFTRFDIEDLVGQALVGRYHSRRHGVPPTDRIEWRVVLDGKTMWLGRRPYDVPLHRRPWRQRTVVGSLHPPVAAAMARLAHLAPGHRVLDPYCGAGTLLIEAGLLEPRAQYTGFDRDPDAVAAARANSPALRLSRPAGTYDRIITNPPWGVRLPTGRLPLELLPLRPGGRLVAILQPEQVAELSRTWRILEVHDVSVAGRHPRIVVARPYRKRPIPD